MWRLSKRRLLLYFLLLICANTFLFRVFEEIFKWKASPKYSVMYVNSLNNVGTFMNSALRNIRNPIKSNILMKLKGRFYFNDSSSNDAILLLNGSAVASYDFGTITSTIRLSNTLTERQFSNIRNIHHRKMIALHQKVLNQLSDEEIQVQYKKYENKRSLFKNVLNIESDRKLLSTLFPNPLEKDDRLLEQYLLKLNVSEQKIILQWQGDKASRKRFEKKNCNVKNCIITNDISYVDRAHAIIFKKRAERLPKNRKKDQILLFTSLESPLNNPYVQFDKNIANWSITYRSDSVIATPYGKFIPFANVSTFPTKPIKNYAQGRNGKVAWFVSNCLANNNRLKYAKELQKHISVDIYGGCGDKVCIKQEQKRCQKEIAKKYKFYLAFENSLCKDYISEKLFKRAHRSNLIPIVMGAHPDEYKEIAPPRSYIHVDMFLSAKELADYLNFLDQHDEYYNDYFLWKQTGEYADTSYECRLCAMLHLAPHFPMWYESANDWWRGSKSSKACLSGTDEEIDWKNRESHTQNQNAIKYGYKKDFKAREIYSI